jgi:hypothetical protein
MMSTNVAAGHKQSSSLSLSRETRVDISAGRSRKQLNKSKKSFFVSGLRAQSADVSLVSYLLYVLLLDRRFCSEFGSGGRHLPFVGVPCSKGSQQPLVRKPV